MKPFYRDRPLNFAHRGACHAAPENTLAAFALAAELGAEGIEFDVQLSKDGQPVVIHDFDLETTTDGKGPVGDRTLAELEELDAGAWFDPVYTGERIPTLQAVIDLVGHRLLLNVELKSRSFRDEGLAAATVAAVETNNLVDRVVISSFNPLEVWRVKRLNPAIAVGMLYESGLPYPLRQLWLRHLVRPEALHPHWSMVDDPYVRWAKERGYRVHTWTVDDPAVMLKLVRQQVDLIITNEPDVLSQVLQAGGR